MGVRDYYGKQLPSQVAGEATTNIGPSIILILLIFLLIGCISSVPQEQLDFIRERSEQFVLNPPHNWQAVEDIELIVLDEDNLVLLNDPNVKELICYSVDLRGINSKRICISDNVFV